jgi:hypothetical protein
VKLLPTLLAGLSVAGCDLSTYDVVVGPSGHRVHFTGGDGSSFDKAIVIHESKQDIGVPSEFDYIGARYPHSQETRQDLVKHNGKMYSVRTFFDGDQKQHTLYFDESHYYGNL